MQLNKPEIAYQPGVALDDLQLIIDKIPRNVWDALRGQRIFITGGTGFVGCWLLEALIWANQELALNLSLTILSRNPEAFIAKAPHLAQCSIVNLLKGDVNNLQTITASFDTVIHAATDVVNPDTDFVVAYNAIVEGTRETLELAKRAKAKRYLLTSSGAVYGRQPSTLPHIPETYAGAPDTAAVNSAYGQAKRISEWLSNCYAQQFSLEVKIARCFALIGPYLPLNAHFAVGNFIRDGLDNNNIAVSGDGSAYRSYLYAADMVIWLLTILINGQSGQSYNLGSNKDLSIKDLAEKVSNIIYGKNKVTVATQPSANNLVQRYVPDIAKAEKELGLIEYTSLTSSIQKTISWEIRNRELNLKK